MRNQLLAALVGVGLSGVAMAQDAGAGADGPQFNAQNYRPPIDARRTLWTDDSGLAVSNSWMGKLVVGYAKGILSVTNSETGKEQLLLDSVLETHLIVGYTIWRMRMGVDMPFYPSVTSDVLENQSGLGDLAFDVRGTLMDPYNSPFGLALAARLIAPTATVDLPLGAGGLGYEVSAIADKRFGSLLAAVNVGHRGVPAQKLDNIEVDDQIMTRLGLGYTIVPAFGLSADVAGNIQYNKPMGNAANGAWEGLYGFWVRFNEFWIFRAGAGSGLTEAIGTPKLRTVFSFGYEPEPARDRDGDGILDEADKCPDDPEDMDGWEDEDGCPELASPVHVLLRDPYGYPVDNVRAEIWKDGEQKESGGAKFTVGLNPGIYTIRATAEGYRPLEEDFTVEKGKATDVVKAMSPMAPPPRVQVTREEIRITEKVYFEVDSAVLKAESHSILNAVARTMQQHEDILILRVEGHTDSRASESYNQTLSERRAAAVRDYMASQGVSSDRLRSVGKGESEPLDQRETTAAWDLNRRVEFHIEQRRE
jgi:outer membrane protein OmpA-like peptidoglycan-associated protein